MVGVPVPDATQWDQVEGVADSAYMVFEHLVNPGRLKLKVNESKSAVDRPQNRRFLGFSFTGGKSANRRKISPKALGRFKARVKELTRRNQGRSLGQIITALDQYLRGWIGYFGFCQTSSVLRDLDSWIRHRLRSLQWKQWKVYRRRKAELIKRGIRPELAHTTAFSAKGPWRISHIPGVRMALNNHFFDRMGLIRLRRFPRIILPYGGGCLVSSKVASQDQPRSGRHIATLCN
jgi:RNA-directed DNA polymerase